MQTTLHNSPGTLVFWCQRSWWNSDGIIPNEGIRYRWGRWSCVCRPIEKSPVQTPTLIWICVYPPRWSA